MFSKKASKLPKLKIPIRLTIFSQTFLRWMIPDTGPDGGRVRSASFSGIFLIVFGLILLISSLFPKPVPSLSFPILVVVIVLFNLIYSLLGKFFKAKEGIISIVVNLFLLAGLMYLASSFSPKLALNISLAYLVFPIQATLILSLRGVFLLVGIILSLLTFYFLTTGTLLPNLNYLLVFSLILGTLTVFLHFFRPRLPSRDFLREKILASNLTGREKEILFLLGEGKANKEIALSLGICEKTVRNELSLIYRKLNVTSRQEALLRFL